MYDHGLFIRTHVIGSKAAKVKECNEGSSSGLMSLNLAIPKARED